MFGCPIDLSLPATDAASERSFSSMNRIKTCLFITVGHSFKSPEDIECLQGIIDKETLILLLLPINLSEGMSTELECLDYSNIISIFFSIFFLMGGCLDLPDH